jgi:hypothetical protein
VIEPFPLVHALRVRVGTPEDVDGVMAMALKASAENSFVQPLPERLLEEIYPPLCLDRGIVGIIGGIDDPYQGAIVLRIGKMWYSNEDVLEEKAVFVDPVYRAAKGGRARLFCEFAKRAALEMNLPLLIGVLSNDRTEAKVRLYERQFGKPAGAFFLWNAITASAKAAQNGR